MFEQKTKFKLLWFNNMVVFTSQLSCHVYDTTTNGTSTTLKWKLIQCQMYSIDVESSHSLYKPTWISNIQYRFTRIIHCAYLRKCPICNIEVQCRHSLYKPAWISNIQYRFTRIIHCAYLRECPMCNIEVQCRHSLNKPTWISNVQYRNTTYTLSI